MKKSLLVAVSVASLVSPAFSTPEKTNRYYKGSAYYGCYQGRKKIQIVLNENLITVNGKKFTHVFEDPSAAKTGFVAKSNDGYVFQAQSNTGGVDPDSVRWGKGRFSDQMKKFVKQGRSKGFDSEEVSNLRADISDSDMLIFDTHRETCKWDGKLYKWGRQRVS